MVRSRRPLPSPPQAHHESTSRSPRELRDVIYGHLLDAEQVVGPSYRDIRVARAAAAGHLIEEHPRDVNLARTYDFQTNILAVNKTINKEASETFRKNTFIVVAAAWSGLTTILFELDVPIVCEGADNTSKYFKYASLALCPSHPDSQSADSNSVVLAGRDLPKNSMAMSCVFRQLPMDHLLTFPGNGNRQVSFALNPDQDRLRPVMMDIIYMDYENVVKQADSILPQIKSMSVPGQKVEVYRGCRRGRSYDHVATNYLAGAMSRTTFPPDVFFWDSLKIAVHIKKAADDMVCKGLWGEQQALARYSNVFRTVRGWGFQRFIDNTVNPHTLRVVGAGKIPLYLILELLTDVLSNAAELQMRLQGMQGERLETLYDLQLQIMESAFFLQDNPYSTTPQRYSLHPSHLLTACEDLMHGQQHFLQRAKAMFEHDLQYTDPQDTENCQRLEHDIAELGRILQSPELLDKFEQQDPEVWQSLSCFHFPPRVFDSGILDNVDHLTQD